MASTKKREIAFMDIKSSLLIVCAGLFSLHSHSAFSSEPLMWSEKAKTAYQDLNYRSWYSRSRFQTNAYNKKIGLVALKNNSTVTGLFSEFTVRKVEGKSLSGRTVRVSTIGTQSCQCVAFVKEMAENNTAASSWIEGASLLEMKNNSDNPHLDHYSSDINTIENLAVGTVIATFNGGGKYDNIHTAIVVGKSGSNDWIQVIDQNWSPVIDNKFIDRETDPNNIDDLHVENSPNCEWNALTGFENKEKKGFVMTHRIYFDSSKSRAQNAYSYSVVEI